MSDVNANELNASQNSNAILQRPLIAQDLPLTGSHIIEASAGTGKTFNITRIYLRLLLEKRHKVQSILVVTFTKAACEELKGRIGSTLRDAYANWDEFEHSDDAYYRHLYQQIAADDAKVILHYALMHLDETAIFTIHGFCKRILSSNNMLAGLAFNLAMEQDISDVLRIACEDEYRKLAAQADVFDVISERFATPEDFLRANYAAITSHLELVCAPMITADYQPFWQQKAAKLAQLHANEAIVFAELIDKHKESQQRRQAWQALLAWLAADDLSPMCADAYGFLDGRRFGKKTAIKELLGDIRPLQTEWLEDYPKRIALSQVANYVQQSIIHIRQGLIAQKALAEILDFNDLIIELDRALNSQSENAVSTELATKLADEYPAILVDEFQDTDAEQYRIFQRIHSATPSGVFFMIGDPKQAIYGFRGGDVFTYLAARQQAQFHWVMDGNWRSSQNMVSAYNRLFYGQDFTEQADLLESNQVFGFQQAAQPVTIGYTPVKAMLKETLQFHDDERVGEQAALQWLMFDSDESKITKSFQQTMACDMAGEIQRLLQQNVHYQYKEQFKEHRQPLAAKDIAILVRSRAEASVMQQALQDLGIASVFQSNRDNVFATVQATHWLHLLRGILHAEQSRLVTAAMATPLMGLSVLAVAKLHSDEQAWESALNRLAELKQLWRQSGFMSMALEVLRRDCHLYERQRERALTNYLQLVELLHAQSKEGHTMERLVTWLERQIQDPMASGDRELRLESEQNLIQIVTQHGCKGLEYPVVFVPFASFGRQNKQQAAFIYRASSHPHSKSQEHCWQIGASADQPSWLDAQAANAAEDIRLLYVAITRAVYRCYIGVAQADTVLNSPLGLMLKLNDKAELIPAISAMCANQAASCMAMRTLAQQNSTQPQGDLSSTAGAELSVQRLNAPLYFNWRMHSYSGLSFNRTNRLSSIDGIKESDEPIVPTPSPSNSDLVRFTFTKGAQSGLLLHEILEKLPFHHVNQTNAEHNAWAHLLKYQSKPQLLDAIARSQTWLTEVVNTPLMANEKANDGDYNHNHNQISTQLLPLSALQPEQCLKETSFYFPLHNVSLTAFSELITRWRLIQNPNAQPVQLAHASLYGMMNGVIDLIFEHQGKYYVVDYKSNHLGDDFAHYQTANLLASIEMHHYDVQYLIYSLALHRYLKTRLPDYDPDRHFGGVFYLFIRGMAAEQGNSGQYFTPLNRQILEQLDALFAGVDVTDKGAKHAIL